MKQRSIIFIFLLLGCTILYAQHSTISILTDLNTTKAGQGDVNVYEDEAISGLIGTKHIEDDKPAILTITPNHFGNDSVRSNNSGPVIYKEVAGYKIQVFSGNDQRRSKNEANRRKDKVRELFPDMDVIVSFNSPVWRVRAGNFATYEQAFQAMTEMKKTFSSFGREMQIVKSMVKLPIN